MNKRKHTTIVMELWIIIILEDFEVDFSKDSMSISETFSLHFLEEDSEDEVLEEGLISVKISRSR